MNYSAKEINPRIQEINARVRAIVEETEEWDGVDGERAEVRHLALGMRGWATTFFYFQEAELILTRVEARVEWINARENGQKKGTGK